MTSRRPREMAAKERRCICLGESLPVAGLIRFVAGPAGELVPDLEERLPGRGLWLSAERDMLNTAVRKRLFSRAARRQLTVPEDLPARVEGLLVRRAIRLLGLARRADQVVLGADRVDARLRDARRSGQVGVLVAASDGALGGRAKIRALAPEAPVFDVLSASEIGAGLGRDRVVHAVVGSGGLADMLVREGIRLRGFRPLEDPEGRSEYSGS